MNRDGIFSLTLCFSLLVLFSCTDTTIEGASTTTTGFTISKTTSTNSTINAGTCTSGGKTGTNFTVTVEYKGSEVITGIKLTYRFSSGTTGTQTLTSNLDYVDTPSGATGTFRGASVASNVKIYSCVTFGTSTSIAYDYTFTMKSLKTYTTSITINKPTGAN